MKKHRNKIILYCIITGVLLLFATGPVVMFFNGEVDIHRDWRAADKYSSGIAPDPATIDEAIVQVYAARAVKWRGLFAVHTWIATKQQSADHYMVHHVIGWNEHRNLPVVVSRADLPDRLWYGNQPELVGELRGEAATSAIDDINAAVAAYPYTHDYTAWPGPNSNTFTAFIGRQVPLLELDLPPVAIGKDFLSTTDFLDVTPSGAGFQISLFGLAGLLVSRYEGIEFNILGLVIGLDPAEGVIKLPGIGRVKFGGESPRTELAMHYH